MDGDSGRVLYQKSGNTPRPNASTTKVMTCILALENGKGDDYVKVSANAVSQPEVRLGLSIGEQYYLEDLLYSLMLQSHNDSAVAIAECIGGSVDNFSAMMNAKAKEIGCKKHTLCHSEWTGCRKFWWNTSHNCRRSGSDHALCNPQ